MSACDGKCKNYPFCLKDRSMEMDDRLKLSLKGDDSSLISPSDRDGMLQTGLCLSRHDAASTPLRIVW